MALVVDQSRLRQLPSAVSSPSCASGRPGRADHAHLHVACCRLLCCMFSADQPPPIAARLAAYNTDRGRTPSAVQPVRPNGHGRYIEHSSWHRSSPDRTSDSRLDHQAVVTRTTWTRLPSFTKRQALCGLSLHLARVQRGAAGSITIVACECEPEEPGGQSVFKSALRICQRLLAAASRSWS